ncbi:hypothetical protein WJX81_006842 [Elliptochloris bilobata]|uniref:Uncharacterized protein n=1 Tax=Elliptochloris bilobata TaxID=381761 RepID=A0AAW1RLB6_9CHLO
MAQSISWQPKVHRPARVFKRAGTPCRRVPGRPAVCSATQDLTGLQKAAIPIGAASNVIMLISEYTLKTTGKGLPEGPGGIFGALEGVSYLVVLGIIGWSVSTKLKTGQGLPSGPGGALGAVEGLSYLSILGAVAVFGLTFLERGSLPGPLG